MTAQPSRRRRPPRLADVAELAGVSMKTVSNVVHGYAHVRPETRKKVQAAIDRTGYRPQLAAQQLRKGSSDIVTLAVPSLTFGWFSDIAQHFIDQARVRSRTVVLHTTSDGREQELEVFEGFKRRLGDGVIYSPLLIEEEIFARTAEFPQPTVLIGEHVPEASLPRGSDYVRIDNTRAMADATAHLLDGGREHPAFIGALPIGPVLHPHSSAALRMEGFRRALDERGIDPASAPAPEVENWHRADGRDAALRLLEEHPEVDAIVCGNDELALGVLAGLREGGRSVPEDVAVVGYDDSPDAPFAFPTLTSISPDKAFLARIALDMLIERIEGHDGPPRIVTAPHQLVVRDSSAPRH
ncbi:LacI family DNA-binding transcriptional regulator [Brachybacterium sp. DNPG3]